MNDGSLKNMLKMKSYEDSPLLYKFTRLVFDWVDVINSAIWNFFQEYLRKSFAG
jgi:hypothetical protein